MSKAMRQMPERSGRVGVVRGEAASQPASDEARGPSQEHQGTGSAMHTVGAGTLLEAALTRENLQAAWKRVKANKGAAGVDGLAIEHTHHLLQTKWPQIRQELLAGKYRPSPVRRVMIPKPDGSQRELGIPTVTDRLIQQALLQVLQPLIDPTFSDHSHGFRPGRSAHDAVKAARAFVQSGKRVVVDVDLATFFDRVNHDILVDRLKKRIPDAAVLRLIRAYLNVGIMDGGVKVERQQGTPQGGPLSPLLANVLLDEVDTALEARGYSFARYADDCVPRRRKKGSSSFEQPCCTRDGGGPLEAGVQAQASNHPLRLRLRGVVVSELGKGRVRPDQVGIEETNASEPLMTCRKRRNDVETTGQSLLWDRARGVPVYGPSGIRHEGGVKSIQALVRNVGTCRPDAKGETQMVTP